MTQPQVKPHDDLDGRWVWMYKGQRISLMHFPTAQDAIDSAKFHTGLEPVVSGKSQRAERLEGEVALWEHERAQA